MSLDVPEAWSLDRVREVVQAVKDGVDIGPKLTLSARHVAYHLQAARVVGWLTKDGKALTVTPMGDQLLITAVGSLAEREFMRTAVLDSLLVTTVLPSFKDGMTQSEIATAFMTHPETKLAKATADKRSGYLMKWLERIGGPHSPSLVTPISVPQSQNRTLSQSSQPTTTAGPMRTARGSKQPPNSASSPTPPTSEAVPNAIPSASHSSRPVPSTTSTAQPSRTALPSSDPRPNAAPPAASPPVVSNPTSSTAKVSYGHSFKSEIRPSQIKGLLDKVRKQSYAQYLRGLRLATVRGFSDQPITFDFPVTALIGPNGGGKTTILGAAACAYKGIPPRQFFAKSGRFDDSMQDWSVEYDIVDKTVDPKATFKRSATFRKSRWYRDALKREVMVFGVARTVPATERAELRKCASNSFKVADDKISRLTPEVIEAAQIILAKEIKDYTHMRIGGRGKVTLLAGMTSAGVKYSEFHFGAGESSIIRMAIRLETAKECALVLIEEIENGLHPVATIRMVEYLIGVAERKRLQVIFTTHSEDALLPLPPEAIWAAVERKAFQGSLSIHSLRAITSQIEAKLAIFTEDTFAAEWVRGMLRSEGRAALDAIEIHAMHGDGTATLINVHHNRDPSMRFPSVCIIDGDSQQRESERDLVFRLPGKNPEMCVFEGVMDSLDDCAGKLTIALHLKFQDEQRVRAVLKEVALSNQDPHLIFSQIGERLGLLSEVIVRGAFISIWCELFATVVRKLLVLLDDRVPTSIN